MEKTRKNVSKIPGQALVRLNYWSLRFFAARDSNAFALAGAELQRVDVLAPQERLKDELFLLGRVASCWGTHTWRI